MVDFLKTLAFIYCFLLKKNQNPLVVICAKVYPEYQLASDTVGIQVHRNRTSLEDQLLEVSLSQVLLYKGH